ncbi:ABC transporter six-transmembrane domain-containing protein [Ferruginibacter albus]|uniref:ABC transporter six-transmembrane domain-containing protein n=1 Tax=Ferruginibacter albus TaxID=2875540 RepID=UPI001CC7D2D0|nr:ABC transporter six-transmembrane domain-containing protein [Ferruginibacter albus]UAY52064.1 ABC transporter six-transmembrane domain-containing protein [Ferruginibacter albus]
MKKHRYQLILTYILFSLEMIGSLLRPFFLGEAVNDLMHGSYHGLIMLSIVHMGYLIAGTIRHMYDTRTYSAIYTSLVTKFISRRIAKTQISKMSAHSTLAKEFVDFLEFDLVYVMEAVYNIFGSLILLYFYNHSVVLVCLAILLPVVGISYFYGRKMKRLTKMKNDELETQVDIISSGNRETIFKHYDNLRKWQIRISDQEAWNFGFMELMVVVVIAAALFVTNNVIGTTILAGNLIGIYNYILKFVSGLDTIPYTVQRLTSLSDITRRIELQEEDIPEEAKGKLKYIEPIYSKTKVAELFA